MLRYYCDPSGNAVTQALENILPTKITWQPVNHICTLAVLRLFR